MCARLFSFHSNIRRFCKTSFQSFFFCFVRTVKVVDSSHHYKKRMELAAHSTKILSNHLGRSNHRLWYFQEFLTWRAVIMFSVSVLRRNGPLHWVWPSLSVHAIRYFNKLISRLSRWSPTFHQFSCIFTVIRGTYGSFSQDIPTVVLATETIMTHGHVSTALKHIFRSRFSFLQ